ncbi:MAG: Fe-S-containing protein [Bryobacteraceae bacterium]
MTRKRHRIELTRRELFQVWGALGTLAAFGVFSLWWHEKQHEGPPTVAVREDLRVPLASLEKGKLYVFSSVLNSPEAVKFTVQRQSAESIQVAFASCRRCYRKGSSARGNEVICGHCNDSMRVTGIDEKLSTAKDCTRIRLPYSMEQGDLVVYKRTIREQFERWFLRVLEEK